MKRTLNIRKQQGFTMVEALFSALILGIALLALAGFQAVALQDSSLVKARSVAANLAQEKLDDLRSFTFITDGTTSDDGNAASTSNYCGQGTFCFTEIASSSASSPYGGGQEQSNGTLNLAHGSVSGYLDNYTRSWDVKCSSEAAATAFSFSTTCNASTVAKLVTVTIQWTDRKSGTQTVTLQGVIYAMDPSSAARGSINPFSTEKPTVSYTPIGVPDAVPVPINTGGDKYKESSKPLPDVSSKGYSLRTSFDAVSYTTGTPAKKDSQLEFATVSCVCEFASNGQGNPASYFYWDGASLQIKVPSATVTKMTATAPSIQGDPQDSLCSACCRDHHDSEAPGTSSPTTALYDPDRPAGDYNGNDHKHYYYVDPADPTQGLVEVAPTTGNRYLEACRFARVDGFWRLLQDWRALDEVVMPYNNYLNVSTTLTAYQTYLLNYLKYQTYADCSTSGATGCSSITQTSAPSKSGLATRNLTSQNPGNVNQLLARALYSDRVYGKTAPRTLDTSYYNAVAGKIGASADWLNLLPFNEVNVTLLANWASSDTSVVTVTNESISDITANNTDYYNVYSRGSTVVQSGNGGSADITAYLLPSNSGLTGGVKRAPYAGVVDYDSNLAASGTIAYAGPIGIDTDDHRSGNRKSNSLNIARATVYSTTTLSGSIRIGNANASFLTSNDIGITRSPTADITCTVAAPVAGVSTYSCITDTSYNGTLTFTTNQTNAFFDVGSDLSYDTENTEMGYASSSANVPENVCNITSGVMTNSCKNFWLFGPVAEVRGKCHGTAADCAGATIVSKLGGNGTNVSCTISGFDVTCPVTLDTSTKNWTGTVQIAGTHVTASTTCSSSDGTSATTSSITAGPADKPSAFDVCVTTAAAVAPPVPSPAWVGTNPKTVSWTGVLGATMYKVYQCTTTNNNSLTACGTGSMSLIGAQGTTTYNPGAPSSKDTICVAIKSSDGTLDSNFSGVRCIYYKTSTGYSYQ